MIFNISNAPARVLPVLNSSYPQDVSLMESASGSATFQVQIATDGKPAKYTYQWYVNGSAVSGANGTSFTKTGLTSAASYTVYCTVTNKAGTVTSRVATLTVTSSKPVYTYTGNATFTQEDTYNWQIKFLTSGNFTFSYLGNAASGIDVFCVGGGGGGNKGVGTYCHGAGGGGGRTTNSFGIIANTNTSYSIVIGGGGASAGSEQTAGTGGTSSAFNVSAAGGNGAPASGNGGAGGSGGGAIGWTTGSSSDTPSGDGGSDGGNGGDGWGDKKGGQGQGSTTRAFGDSNGELFAGGGGGACVGDNSPGGAGGGAPGGFRDGVSPNAVANMGGGGGAGRYGGNYPCDSGSGGSGIVVIRNHR